MHEPELDMQSEPSDNFKSLQTTQSEEFQVDLGERPAVLPARLGDKGTATVIS